MKNKTAYHPISCGFHDELQLFALRKKAVPIVYRKTDGEVATIESTISDLYTREKEEFLLLPSGEEIRLERLVSVGGIRLEN